MPPLLDLAVAYGSGSRVWCGICVIAAVITVVATVRVADDDNRVIELFTAVGVF